MKPLKWNIFSAKKKNPKINTNGIKLYIRIFEKESRIEIFCSGDNCLSAFSEIILLKIIAANKIIILIFDNSFILLFHICG
jgi:hypothetical protein